MNNKAENLKEIEYYNNYNIIGDLLLTLKKQNPEDTRYIRAVEAMTELGFFVNGLLYNQRYIDKAISEYRTEKIRAVERARRAEND